MAKCYPVDIYFSSMVFVCVCSRIVLGLNEHLMAKALFFIVFVFVFVFVFAAEVMTVVKIGEGASAGAAATLTLTLLQSKPSILVFTSHAPFIATAASISIT